MDAIRRTGQQGNITENSASLWFNQTSGILTLGGQQQSLVTTEWQSHRLFYNFDSCCSNPFWMLRLDDLLIDDQSILTTEDEALDAHNLQYAILESTSPFIFLKESQFKNYIE